MVAQSPEPRAHVKRKKKPLTINKINNNNNYLGNDTTIINCMSSIKKNKNTYTMKLKILYANYIKLIKKNKNAYIIMLRRSTYIRLK